MPRRQYLIKSRLPRVGKWLAMAVTIGGGIVAIVGLGGVPEAVATWKSWFEWLDGNWIISLLGFGFVIAGLLWLFWPQIIRRVTTTAFSIRPFHSDPVAVLMSEPVALLARIGIRNNGSTLLRRCSVRLLDAMPIRFGFVQSAPTVYPSILQSRGESFLLHWSSSEKNRTGDYHQYLDLAPDGSEHYVSIFYTDYPDDPDGDISIARFAAIDRSDLQGKLQGIGGKRWWQIILRIASESDTPNVTDIELLASYWPDNGPPSYILLYDWLPRGEAILQHQSAERKAKKRPKPNLSD